MDKVLLECGRKYLNEMGFKKEAQDNISVINFLQKIKDQEGMQDFAKTAGFDWNTLRNYWKKYQDWMSNDVLGEKGALSGLGIKKREHHDAISNAIAMGIPAAFLGSMTTPQWSNQSGFGRGMAGLALGGTAGYFAPQLNKLLGYEHPGKI